MIIIPGAHFGYEIFGSPRGTHSGTLFVLIVISYLTSVSGIIV